MQNRYFLPVMLAVALILSAVSKSQDPQRVSRDVPNTVEVTRDFEYANYGERTLLLDLYRPAERDGATLPVVVVIRGGGWRLGDKEGFGHLAADLATRGFAAVCIEYRTSGEAIYPAAVHDVKAAVRWVRANAEDYQLNPDAIGAIGGSAGAHLAAFSGVTADDPSLEGDGGNPEMSSALQAVVAMAAPADFEVFGNERARDTVETFLGAPFEDDPDLWRRASPVHHVDASSPPVLLIHSSADPLVGFEHSTRLARKYGDAGRPVELVLIPDVPHGFWNRPVWFEDTMNRAAAFFARHLVAGDQSNQSVPPDRHEQ